MTADQPYQVMPPLAEAEYDALTASIAAGYDPAHPVVVDENGVVLDGHHRQQVCAELGITAPVVILPGLTEDQKHDYAVRANLACRHLTQLQKRDLIRAELDRDPSRSDREIGRLAGADHKTVAGVRRGGEFPHTQWQENAATRIAENAADLLRLADEDAAWQAELRECCCQWRVLWGEVLTALLACCLDWNAAVVQATGHPGCWEWVQAEHADTWERITRNVTYVQDLSPAEASMYGIDASNFGPTPAEAEQLLRGGADLLDPRDDTPALRARLRDLLAGIGLQDPELSGVPILTEEATP